MTLAILATLVPALTILIVFGLLWRVARQEHQAQSRKYTPDPKLQQRFTGYDYAQAVRAKTFAARRADLKRKTAAKRAEAIALESRRRA